MISTTDANIERVPIARAIVSDISRGKDRKRHIAHSDTPYYDADRFVVAPTKIREATRSAITDGRGLPTVSRTYVYSLTPDCSSTMFTVSLAISADDDDRLRGVRDTLQYIERYVRDRAGRSRESIEPSHRRSRAFPHSRHTHSCTPGTLARAHFRTPGVHSLARVFALPAHARSRAKYTRQKDAGDTVNDARRRYRSARQVTKRPAWWGKHEIPHGKWIKRFPLETHRPRDRPREPRRLASERARKHGGVKILRAKT